MYRYWIYLLLFVSVSLDRNIASALPRRASWNFEGEFGDYILQLLTRLDQLVKDAEENRPTEVHTKEQVLSDHYKTRYPACSWAPRTLLKRANEHRLKTRYRLPLHGSPQQVAWTDEEVLLRNCFESAIQLLHNYQGGGTV